jgi:hypothetical protein
LVGGRRISFLWLFTAPRKSGWLLLAAIFVWRARCHERVHDFYWEVSASVFFLKLILSLSICAPLEPRLFPCK